MQKVSLNGEWKLIGAEPQTGSPKDIVIPEFVEGEWIEVGVPGDANAALVKNNRMPNSHYDTEAQGCYWVSAKEWWYCLKFDALDVGGRNTDLCFTNIDGCTDIWLNGMYLGETCNAFRLYQFHIKNLLNQSENILFIRFKSIDQLLGGPRLDRLGGWKARRAFLRKPQFSFGWDWALPIPSIGLAGDVWLEYDNNYRLSDLTVQSFVSGRVDFGFEVTEETRDMGYEIVVKLEGHNASIKKTICRDSSKSYISINIEDPQLWYPNGYGEQPLYCYTVELVVEGVIADTKKGRIGLRETNINENPFTAEAGPGFSFRIVINGVRVFCKGGNWIPLELWPGTIKPEQYEFYLRKAKEANFNMLRVWGGGIYEADIFYELCDELGIMVWQDFMFASSGYPVDVLRDEIIAEADYQIHRLGKHPSIVLWCGCNEDVYSWSSKSSEAKQTDTGVYSEEEKGWKVDRLKGDPQIYSMLLRGMVSKFGLGVPYIESSPQSRDDFGNMRNSGNCHISCWKYSLLESGGAYAEFRKHFEDVCSFNSEFCIQGPSSVKTIKSFLAQENHWPPNDAWVYHIQKGHANLPHHEQTLRIAGALFGEINNLEKYVKYGQATHVEMMRAEFESARRDFPNNGGTMMWMYNDCWPTSNWSIIDYYQNPKPSYYAAKRACAQLLPIIFERKGKLEFLFSNHSLSNIKVDITYGQETLEGKAVWSENIVIKADANSSLIYDTKERSQCSFSQGDYLYSEAIVNGEKLPKVIYFPNAWKDIDWPQPNINVEITEQQQIDNKWHSVVKISTDKFLRLCYLILKNAKDEVSFEDNYFDLSAGCTHAIGIESNQKLSIEDLIVGHWLTKWE